jgi:hypothetical protein
MTGTPTSTWVWLVAAGIVPIAESSESGDKRGHLRAR